uniref:G-protein coupled receptors family 1 profile domain-containing protein n=1 Tax=Sinocyclocheilus grahami TaxID=75366 RepID=A0A672T5N7_SINGR
CETLTMKTVLTLSSHKLFLSLDTEDTVNKISIVFLIIIIFLGTIENSVVIWVAGFRMKPNVTNVWLVNLAVVDLIFCLTRVTSLIRDFFYDYWPFGVFLCKFTGFFKCANMFCSVFLLAVIMFPGKNNLSHCDNSSKYVYYCIRFICGFLLPFLVILICYILAAVGIRRTRLSGKSRPLRILAVLVCAFFLCWAPYHFLGLVKLVNKDNEAVKVALSMASKLAYFNSCINTVLYFCTGLDVSRRCNQSLSGIFHRALMEEGQSLSRQGTREESCNSIPKTADIEFVTKV